MEEAPSQVTGGILRDEMERYFTLLREITQLEAQLDTMKKAKERLIATLVESLGEAKLSQIKDDQGRVIYLKTPAVYASIVGENREEAIRMIRNDWNAGDLFQEVIPPSALSRIVKERLEQGLPVDDTKVRYFLKTGVGHRS